MNKTVFSCNFMIAGAFSKFKKLAIFFTKHKELLKNNTFTVYDGINMCHWNGGRINEEIYWTQSQINYYYRNNISIALTFSNHIIDINDRVGNELLEKFHRKGNKIILVNEELRKHIRTNYP